MTTLDDYRVLDANLGKGSFGQVARIERKRDGKTLVWKEMEYGKMSEKEKKQLVSEVNILRDLRHPNIVRYVDRIIDKDSYKIYVIMEFCEGGDLAQFIAKCRQQRRYIEEDLIWRVLTQLLLALHDCHSRQILHRDIKPGNILLDANKNVKLGDFGLARVLGSKSLFAHTYVGTPFYMSPEQVRGVAYNSKSDVWSLGCLIYEMAALSPPFVASTHTKLIEKIKEGRYRRLPSVYSEDLTKVIKAMLEMSTTRRASVRSLMDFPPIALRLRERKVSQHYAAVKKREEEAESRADELTALKRSLKAREAKLAERERVVSSVFATLKAKLEALGEPVPALESLFAEARAGASREATPELEDAFTISHTSPPTSADLATAAPSSSYLTSDASQLRYGAKLRSRAVPSTTATYGIRS
ncbi:NEK protein kinase [Thecamonas trahens ATCC 50062]|uniref:non-specific serine/threonine protein kinase n=1 Tax=Thecamonas trahens ATCC 50062 TaxID=461836 RepID=A0A0L0DA00_THETB|nr:NEK protein kinase [Thecamonas trahens ATCC 50062]KNC49192.1 NEK protein kinase [Thecamonas trahens ATCC 50062]|eukprot:XP_013758211.1 NEK protein kinase [Thecamonas trahens ATCC 50062]